MANDLIFAVGIALLLPLGLMVIAALISGFLQTGLIVSLQPSQFFFASHAKPCLIFYLLLMAYCSTCPFAAAQAFARSLFT